MVVDIGNEIAERAPIEDARVAAPAAKPAVLVLAEIKSATEAFDRGEINAFDALDAIEVALDAYRDAAQARRDAA